MKPYLLWSLIGISALAHAFLFYFLSGYSFWEFSHKKNNSPLEKVATVQLSDKLHQEIAQSLTQVDQQKKSTENNLFQENLQSVEQVLAHHRSENIANATELEASEKVKGQLFGATSEGFRFVYLLDVSGSMLEKVNRNTTRLDHAKEEIKHAITQLPEVAEFNILLFADRVVTFSPQCLPATTSIKKQAIDFLNQNTSLSGVTDIIGGLAVALEQWPDVIFLLTDGISNTSEEIFRSQWQYLYRQSRSQTQISVIGFLLDSQQENLLQEMANFTQGKFWHWSGN